MIFAIPFFVFSILEILLNIQEKVISLFTLFSRYNHLNIGIILRSDNTFSS